MKRVALLSLVLCLAAGLAPAETGPEATSPEAAAAPGPEAQAASEPEAEPKPPAPSTAPATAPSAPKPDDPAPGGVATPPASPIWVSTEVRFPNYFSSVFYAFYGGDRVDMRLLIHNVSQEEVAVPKDLDLLGGLRVKGEGGDPLEAAPQKAVWKDSPPQKLAPGQVVGALFNLSEVFPGFSRPDNYTIQWESGEWKSNPVAVRIIPRFEPGVDYEATLETGEGNITIALRQKEAPAHVLNFVNLARLGYYDGMPFHTAARDRSIRTGAPGPDGSGTIGYLLPAEISSLKHVAGAVSMYRDQRFPGNESDGSQFFICLTDIPSRDGKFTVFGTVSKGLEVAKKISERETVTDPRRPAGTPRDPARIQRVIVREIRRADSQG